MKTTNKKEWPVAIKSIVLAMAGAGLVSLPYMANANPTGSQVVAGNITIRQESTSKIGITQTTANGIIDWQKYSIGANEQVQYYQPSTSSVTLNRVVGQDPSQILGRLTANGQIFLVNPNGIFFGKNAQVDVAGLVASTHNIRNEDFLAGKYNFNSPGKPGAAVINEGTIRIADTGIAAFVAPSVANRGVIVARLGKVALAAASGFTLDFHGDQLLSFLVTDEVAKNAFDIDGKQLTSFVENSGRIVAQGGYVLLTAKAAESAIHGVINQSGVIEATSVGLSKGEIILNAGKGSLEVSGTLDASALNGGDGGFIETSGAQLSIAENTIITTAAPQGKTGTWLIDPQDILIATGGSGGFSSGTSLAFGSNPNGLTTLAPSLLNSATSNIVLEATRDIEFRDAVNVRQAGVGLTARAGRDIKVNAEIKTNNGAINLLAGWDRTTNTPAVNDGIVDINGVKVDSGSAARNIIDRGPSTSGLVGYWDFNGDAKDGSGNGNNGTPEPSIVFTTDGSRQIAKFGGISNPGAIFVANSATLQFAQEMTLAYWVRADGSRGMDGYGGGNSANWVNSVVAKSHDRSGFVAHLYDSANRNQDVSFTNNPYGASAGISGATRRNASSLANEWVHIAFAISGTDAKLYVNGVLTTTTPGTYNFAVSNTQNMYFGRFSSYWYPLNGALDEVRMYNRTLTGAQVAEVYQGRTAVVTPPSIGNPIISGSAEPPPNRAVFIASAVSYAFKNPLTETSDVFDQFVGGKIKSKTGSVPVNNQLIYVDTSQLKYDGNSVISLDFARKLTVKLMDEGSNSEFSQAVGNMIESVYSLSTNEHIKNIFGIRVTTKMQSVVKEFCEDLTKKPNLGSFSRDVLISVLVEELKEDLLKALDIKVEENGAGAFAVDAIVAAIQSSLVATATSNSPVTARIKFNLDFTLQLSILSTKAVFRDLVVGGQIVREKFNNDERKINSYINEANFVVDVASLLQQDYSPNDERVAVRLNKSFVDSLISTNGNLNQQSMHEIKLRMANILINSKSENRDVSNEAISDLYSLKEESEAIQGDYGNYIGGLLAIIFPSVAY